MLNIVNISKKFNHNIILDNISFNLKNNEFIAILGPSGCGKTTLLKLIAGLNIPTKGKIFLGNNEIKHPTRNIGFVFQEYTSFPWLTVKKNIEFGSKNKELVEHYLELMNLKEFENIYPNRLSGGQKQRVAIARTLVNNPDVILMDEPFGSLDAQTRTKMQQLLLKVWSENKKTIIFVTHDIDEAIFLSDRIIILSKLPAKIIKEIKIPFNRPRKQDIFKEKRHIELKEKIISFLE